MRVFIVHAHPEPKSFCTAMKSAAVEEFEQQGHEVCQSASNSFQLSASKSFQLLRLI